MFRTMGVYRSATLIAALAAMLMGVPRVAQAAPMAIAGAQSDSGVANEVMSKLDKKQFKNVKATVDNNGVVTLGGHARTDVDKDSAMALVSTYPGVKEVNNEVEVDPVSIMDDQTRMAVAHAVYGTPTLQRYATDPAKPIRISVQNGHVELAGVVDSQADKELAYMKANQVPAVFSVKNNLQV